MHMSELVYTLQQISIFKIITELKAMSPSIILMKKHSIYNSRDTKHTQNLYN